MRKSISSSATVNIGLGIFALGGVCAALLAGCGGGGPAVAPTTVVAATTYVTSSSSATPTVALPPATTMRYMIQGAVTSVEGTSAAFTQDASFALTSIGNNSLASINGTYAVQEYMGNATFAQGRWTKGNATVNGGAVTPPLTGTDSRAVHYLVTQDLSAFIDGTYKCTGASISAGSKSDSIKSDVRSSGLTYSGGGSVFDPMAVGAAVPYGAIVTINGGVAKLTFDSSFGLYVTGPNGFESDYKGTQVTFNSPSDMPKYLNNTNPPTLYQSGEEGVALVLGRDTSPDNIVLGVSFRRSLSNGARYQGMSSVVCRS